MLERVYWTYWAAVLLAPLVAAGALWRRRRSLRSNRPFWRSTAYLAAAGLLALCLSAVQSLPTIEYVAHSDRAALEAPRESVAFSFFPVRIVELFFPSFFGAPMPQNARWFPFESIETGVWVPSIYLGVIPAALALAGMRFRGGTVQRRWLTWLTLAMFLLSIGKFSGPFWLIDPNGGTTIDPVRDAGKVAGWYGPSDGLYRICEEAIPGFRQYRYPSKLLVFCVLGAALLAGFSLEQLAQGPPRRWRLVALGCGAALTVALVVLVAAAPKVAGWLAASQADRPDGFGPFQAEQSYALLLQSLLHSLLVLLAIWMLLGLGRRWLAPALVVLTALDLGAAQRSLVMADDQWAIDAKPAVVAHIEAEEARTGASGPFRVHRTRLYAPVHFFSQTYAERGITMSRWERRTVQPKYGLPFDLSYTVTTGTMEIYDVEFFFAPWVVKTPPALRAARPGLPDVLTYYPRTGYNLWNTKYFILPRGAAFDDEERGTFTFLATAQGTPCPIVAESPPAADDYLVLKNPEAFPRAWVVHQAEVRRPIRSLRRQDRLAPMEQLLYREQDSGIHLWQGMPYGAYPLRQRVMLETDEPAAVAPFASGQLVGAGEGATFTSYAPHHLELDVQLEAAGFLIVADTFFPGWSATVDGQPTPILRANRAMRAVPMPAGKHHVAMHYRSRPFEIGAAISALSWLGILGFAGRRWYRRRR